MDGSDPGRAFFWDSLFAWLNHDTWTAAYKLGLALHYMTDLTQPMHSSNYTYTSSSRWGYHTAFEGFVMQVQGSSSSTKSITRPQPTGSALQRCR